MPPASQPPSPSPLPFSPCPFAKITFSNGVVAGLIALPLAFIHKTDYSPAPAKPSASQSSVTAPSKQPAATKAKEPGAAPRHYRPPPDTEAVRLKVDAIIRRHRNMSRDDMLHDQELQQLMAAFSAQIELAGDEMNKK